MDSKSSLKNSPKILGLDISTRCTGFALFEMKPLTLLELKHFSPRISPLPDDKIEELLKKTDAFKKYLESYKDLGIVKVIIEEPLLNSNNIRTVATLMRYNSMLSYAIWDTFGITPSYISTYDSRKYAFSQLTQPNAKGQKVLFGGYPKEVDKKLEVWKLVAEKLPEVQWLYDKKGNLKKESFDMSDAACCVYGFISKLNYTK